MRRHWEEWEKNHNQDILCEKKIYFQKKKKENAVGRRKDKVVRALKR